VSYTDAHQTIESVISAATCEVQNVNDLVMVDVNGDAISADLTLTLNSIGAGAITLDLESPLVLI
jgi:hypothetical protein